MAPSLMGATYAVFLHTEGLLGASLVGQLLGHVRLFAAPWTAAHQASLSFTIFLELAQTCVHWVYDAIQPSHPLLPPSPLALNLFQHQVGSESANESALHTRWPKYWSFSFSTSPSSEYSKLVSFRIDFYTSVIQAEFHINCKWRWNYCLPVFHAILYSFALSLPFFSLLLPSKQLDLNIIRCHQHQFQNVWSLKFIQLSKTSVSSVPW